VIRGEEVYVDGIFVGKPGSGRNLFSIEATREEKVETLCKFQGKLHF
jgi:hypothetical protein